MDLDLVGRKALVTGGTGGIGMACARALAEEGVDLAVAGRDYAALKTATKELRTNYRVEVTSHSCDLRRADHQEALVEVVGDVDILVNTAGAIPLGNLTTIDDGAWRQAWDLKVHGYMNLCRLLLGPMERRGSGVVVNVIGDTALRPTDAYLAGSTANAALDAFTKAVGAATMSNGVRVVGVHPGPTLTPRYERLLRDEAQQRWGNAERWQDLLPVEPPPAEPEQIADVVTFLASDRASHVSGTSLIVNGGAYYR